MKIILVDAINGLVLENGNILASMHDLLETYPNRKIVLTGANDEQFKQFNLDQVPYEVFTLKHNPEKTDPEYFRILLEKYGLTVKDVVYFEHNRDAVESAKSLGINTYFYDHTKEDMVSLKQFLDQNL
jgi:HAD superfamily hydrolase (TIGR01509 family)